MVICVLVFSFHAKKTEVDYREVNIQNHTRSKEHSQISVHVCLIPNFMLMPLGKVIASWPNNHSGSQNSHYEIYVSLKCIFWKAVASHSMA